MNYRGRRALLSNPKRSAEPEWISFRSTLLHLAPRVSDSTPARSQIQDEGSPTDIVPSEMAKSPLPVNGQMLREPQSGHTADTHPGNAKFCSHAPHWCVRFVSCSEVIINALHDAAQRLALPGAKGKRCTSQRRRLRASLRDGRHGASLCHLQGRWMGLIAR